MEVKKNVTKNKRNAWHKKILLGIQKSEMALMCLLILLIINYFLYMRWEFAESIGLNFPIHKDVLRRN
tara:strand:- start:37 stop:240 length:204 start_codon:yes stop_codon:yes gene_type:complete